MTLPLPLNHVGPGDLIRSSDWEAMIEALEALDARVTTLEGEEPETPPAGAPVLSGRTPVGDLHVHDQLTLLGQNFSPLSQTKVDFGLTTISQFGAGSDDGHLFFTVPNMSPQTVTIKVRNAQGTSVKELTAKVLAESSQQSGTVDVQPANDPQHPPNPVAGQPLQLQWTVTSNTLLPETYTFDVVVVNPQPAGSTWPATLNSTQKTLAAGASFTVVATVQVPASGSAGVSLKATSSSGKVLAVGATPVQLTVGQTTPTSDPRIGFKIADPQPDFDSSGTNPSNVLLIHESGQPVVLVTKDSPGFVQIDVDFKDTQATPPVSYRFSSEVDDTAHWTAETPNPSRIVQTHLGGTTSVLYNLTNLATGGALNNAKFTVKAVKLKGNGQDDYVSFTTVSIRNAG